MVAREARRLEALTEEERDAALEADALEESGGEREPALEALAARL